MNGKERFIRDVEVNALLDSLLEQAPFYDALIDAEEAIIAAAIEAAEALGGEDVEMAYALRLALVRKWIRRDGLKPALHFDNSS